MDGMNIAEYQGNPNKGLKEGVVREDFSGEGYFQVGSREIQQKGEQQLTTVCVVACADLRKNSSVCEDC